MKKISIILFISFILSSCSVLFLWNPVFQNIELNEKISFNKDDIAIELKKFGFVNDAYDPELEVIIGNYTKDSLSIDLTNFRIEIGSDTLITRYPDMFKRPIVIYKNEEKTLHFYYEYYLKESHLVELQDGTLREFRNPRTVKLIIGNFRVGNKNTQMPTIEYRNPVKVSKQNGFYEFKKTKFL